MPREVCHSIRFVKTRIRCSTTVSRLGSELNHVKTHEIAFARSVGLESLGQNRFPSYGEHEKTRFREMREGQVKYQGVSDLSLDLSLFFLKRLGIFCGTMSCTQKYTL